MQISTLYFLYVSFLLQKSQIFANGNSFAAETFDDVKQNIFITDFPFDPVFSYGKDVEQHMVLHGKNFTCKSSLDKHDDSEGASFNLANVRMVELKLSTLPCILKSESYWTYVVCVGHFVKQMHRDRVNILGYLQNNHKRNVPKLQGVFLRNKHKTAYFSQLYTGGSTCDITGKERTAEVNFFCSIGNDRIDSIQEVETCRYVIEVYTSKACIGSNVKKAQITMCYPNSNIKFSELFATPLDDHKTDRDFEALLKGELPHSIKYRYFTKSARSVENDKTADDWKIKVFEDRWNLREDDERYSMENGESLMRLINDLKEYHLNAHNEAKIVADESSLEIGEVPKFGNGSFKEWSQRLMETVTREVVEKIDVGDFKEVANNVRSLVKKINTLKELIIKEGINDNTVRDLDVIIAETKQEINNILSKMMNSLNRVEEPTTVHAELDDTGIENDVDEDSELKKKKSEIFFQ